MSRGDRNRRQQVYDAFVAHVEKFGIEPTFRELGEATGMSAPGAWKHVQALIAEGRFAKAKPVRKGMAHHGLVLPDLVDLSPISTDRLRAELARRGVTFDALEEPRLLMNEGKYCAANNCGERVARGRLFCRQHWFGIDAGTRSTIMNAWSSRQMQPFQEALEEARNQLGGFTRVVERVE